MAWKQKVCIAGVGVWGTHLGKLDLVFDQHGVIQNCSGDAVPLDDDITPSPSLQVQTSRPLRHACNSTHSYDRLQAEVANDYNISMAGLDRVIGSAVVPLNYNVTRPLV
jgi:2',3'-cyclic-nucleotide 2'-phosphodiesterase (5'-nucleotidase family)